MEDLKKKPNYMLKKNRRNLRKKYKAKYKLKKNKFNIKGRIKTAQPSNSKAFKKSKLHKIKIYCLIFKKKLNLRLPKKGNFKSKRFLYKQTKGIKKLKSRRIKTYILILKRKLKMQTSKVCRRFNNYIKYFFSLNIFLYFNVLYRALKIYYIFKRVVYFFLLSKYFFHFHIKSSSIKLTLFKKFRVSNFKKMKKIKKLLSTKLLRIKMEKLLFKSFKVNIILYIHSIFKIFYFKNKIKFAQKHISKHSRLFFFKDFLNLFFFAVFFKKSFLLAKFISKNITNKKMHFNILKKVQRVISTLLRYGKFHHLIGLRIKVHGKFQGKLQKRKFSFFFGKPGLTTFFVKIDYNLQQSFTKFGVFSIKV